MLFVVCCSLADYRRSTFIHYVTFRVTLRDIIINKFALKRNMMPTTTVAGFQVPAFKFFSVFFNIEVPSLHALTLTYVEDNGINSKLKVTAARCF